MNTSRPAQLRRIAACTAVALAAGALLAGPATAAGSADRPHAAADRSVPSLDARPKLELPQGAARGTFAAGADGAAPRYDFDADGQADILYRAIDGHYYIARPHLGIDDVELTLGENENVDYKDVIPVGRVDADRYGDLLTLTTDGRLSLYRGKSAANTDFTPVWSGGGWHGFNKVLSPGDLTGDGKADVLARTHDGVLYLYQGTGSLTTPFKTALKIGGGWQYYDHLVGTNDVNGDKIADMVARDTTGNLFTYLGTGQAAAPFKPALKTGTGFGIYNQIVGVEDISGDGLGDLMARTTSGQIYSYAANGSGGFKARLAGATGFNYITQFAAQGGVPDFGRTELLARDTAGTLFWYYSKNNGTLSKREQISKTGGWKDARITFASALAHNNSGDLLQIANDKLYVNGDALTSGWNIYNHLVGPGDVSGDGKGDLLARDKNGVLYLYQGNGAGTGFKTRVKVGAGWNGFTKITGAGDLTGDGRGDLLARAANGDLYVYPGTGQAGYPFKKGIKAGTGYGIYKQLVVAGDLTGDGRADVLATDAAGTLWRYDSYGNAKLTARTKIGTGYQIYSNLY
ncbi:VCBS repeat-containing protein [Streptomyces bambusae]|uniref:FG-GAP repeat domain-containing protein n=1 Tax=Streptomyces bambusae TaxID=1550616 RepID=UPI001CFEFB99|nr:VCBS repeat-containing protein [Streptomyces bambusae]MCB5167922.1 VCBS repeat-containing protein [Streptomyces bambusae]